MIFSEFGTGRIKGIAMALSTVVRTAWATVREYTDAMAVAVQKVSGGKQMPDNDETMQAFENPKPGMRFSEMYSHWVYVLSVSKKGAISVRTFSGHPANPYIDSIKYETFDSVKAFRKKYAYGTIEGYYVRYIDNLAFERMSNETPATFEEIERGYRD